MEECTNIRNSVSQSVAKQSLATSKTLPTPTPPRRGFRKGDNKVSELLNSY